MAELIKAKEINPAELFAGDEPVSEILNQIAVKAREVVALPSTATGRKTLASVAHRVARSKTLLDDMGKALVKDIKAEAGLIDARRRKIRETLDALKAEVRLPLTKWEEREKARVDAIEARLFEMRELFYHPIHDAALSSVSLAARGSTLQGFVIDDTFAEFKQDAETARADAMVILAKMENDKAEAEAHAEAEAKRIEEAESALRAAQEEALKKAAEEEKARIRASVEHDERVDERDEMLGSIDKFNHDPELREAVEQFNKGRPEDGSTEVSQPDDEEERRGRKILRTAEQAQAQEGSPTQQAQEVRGVEEGGGQSEIDRLAEVAVSPAELAAFDLCKFGATPPIAEMLVVAIRLGQIRNIRFVGGS